MIGIAWGFTEPLVSVFNGEGNEALQTMAEEGLRLYFIGFLFAGINIVSAVYLGAVEQAMPSFFIAMSRGVAGNSVFCLPPFRSVWHAGHLAGISGGRRGYLPFDSGFHVAEPKGKNKRSGIIIKCHLKKATSP